ncbi:hypothetical protein BDF22DRAFT_661756 [Syncephalis plumigaleata]|nr:hypothetical protein BDF22DRAFT_661756 [Syncephalis plumigaleata]
MSMGCMGHSFLHDIFSTHSSSIRYILFTSIEVQLVVDYQEIMDNFSRDKTIIENWLVWLNGLYLVFILFLLGHIYRIRKEWTSEQRRDHAVTSGSMADPSRERTPLLASISNNSSSSASNSDYGITQSVSSSSSTPITTATATATTATATTATTASTTVVVGRDNLIVYTVQVGLILALTVSAMIEWRWQSSNTPSSVMPARSFLSKQHSLEISLDGLGWLCLLCGATCQIWCVLCQSACNVTASLARYLIKRLHHPLNYLTIITAFYTGIHLFIDIHRYSTMPFTGFTHVDPSQIDANAKKDKHSLQDLLLLRSVLTLVMLVTLLFLRNPTTDDNNMRLREGGRVMTREAGASIWERASFSWLSPLMKAGRQSGRIEETDLWELLSNDQSSKAASTFAHHRRPSLLLSLLLTFQGDLWKQMGYACLWSLFMYSPPLFLNRLLKAIASKDEASSSPSSSPPSDSNPLDYAYFDAFGLLLGTLLMSACLQQAAFYGQHVAVRTRAILSGLIFEKCLKRRVVQSTPSRHRRVNRDSSVNVHDEPSATHEVSAHDDNKEKKADSKDAGSITNLLNVDVQHISDAFSYTHLFVGSVIQIAVALTFLSFLLGWATAFGIASMLPVYWASRYVGRNFTQVMAQLLSASDRRLSIMNEVMQTIRVIKLFAWEPQFSDKIMKAREVELRVLWQRMMMFIAFMSISMGGPVLIMSVTLGAYTTLLDQALTASVAFTTVALFNSLRRAVEQFPEMLFWLLQCRVSAQRINTFLSEEEVTASTAARASTQSGSPASSKQTIGFNHAFFTWNNSATSYKIDANDTGDESAASTLLNESIVAGPTGSGKSSLLMALLGEMTLTNGQTFLPKHNGSPLLHSMDSELAYVAQQAWLQNITIRENILFGLPYDETRYRQVRFEILDAGDQTQVGEKGVTLSGGQKQRVALARAVYSRARHLLLDDCLSAVDAHTAKHIVDYCLLSPLMYGRTRILVTHHVEMCLAEASLVVVMRAGRVVVQGSAEVALMSGWLPSCSESMTTSRAHSVQSSKQVTPQSSRPASIRERLTNLLNNQDEGESSGDNSISMMLDSSATSGKSRHSHRHKRGRNKSRRQKRRQRQIGVISAAMEEDEDVEMDMDDKQVSDSNNNDTTTANQYNEEEHRASGHVDFTVYRAYIQASVFVFAQPYWLRVWTNAVARHEKEENAHTSLFYLGIYALLGGLVVIAVAIRHYIIIVGTMRAGRNLHQQLTDSILHAKLRFFDATPVGRIMNRFSKDISAIDQELTIALGFFMIDLIEIGAIVLMISIVTPWFLLAGTGIAFIYVVVASQFVAASRDLKRLESVSKSPFLSLLNEAMLGVTTIRAFDAQDRFLMDSLARIDAMNRPTYHLGAANRWLSWRTYLAGSLVSFFTALFILVSLDHIDAGLAGFTLSTALMFSEITMWTVTFYGMLEMSMNGVERVHEYLQIEQEPPAIIESARPSPEWPQQGSIQVENLTMKYTAAHTPVIHDLSFNIQPGERVGIVGRTGAGKSTLAVAFFRFIEAASGRIIIDGVDISKIGLHDLRSRLTIIPQDPILFNGTIRSNLDPFSSHSDEAIWNALRRSHLISVADDGQEIYPAGLESLDAPVSENGSNFSQGQRQLLAMARALLRSSKLIIMDEATASVDFETDTLIQQTVRNEFTEATLLCIAHRLRTIIDYDKVLVMDSGRLAEFDSPSVLIQRKDSLFRRLCEQSGEFDILLAMATTGLETMTASDAF